MYDVSLINLAPGARSAAENPVSVERRGLGEVELRGLLEAFAGIDAVQNAVAAPEIRIRRDHERHRITTDQRKLMVYDVDHRERPALVLTVDEAMAELNGTAQAARLASIARKAQAEAGAEAPRPVQFAPAEAASKPRLIFLGAVALALAAAIVYLQWGRGSGPVPAGFRPVPPVEAAGVQSTLTGVYLTGNQPGSHGIAITSAHELKLFELSAVAAPRIVYVSTRLGRVGSQLALATDQPGGLIDVTDHDTLGYCGETYRRVP